MATEDPARASGPPVALPRAGARPRARSDDRYTSPLFVPSLVFVALVLAAVGSLGAPLITRVATTFKVSLTAAQWTLTLTLLTGSIATPILGRLGSGPKRRRTILCTLGIVAAGSLLTAAPLSFAWLLVGRGAQGIGFALTALMMGVARDHLPPERASATIALLSVTSTIGVGLGYPLTGLLAQLGGLRVAYGFGVAVSVLALSAAWYFVPRPAPSTPPPLDLVGAALVTVGLFPLVLVLSETVLWTRHLSAALALSVASLFSLGAWAAHERRAAAPLVDIRLLRYRPVAAANLAMFVGGTGMYLLITLITRFAQTPIRAGYGFGLNTFEAGLVLVPFSAMGFVTGRVTPRLSARVGAGRLLAVNAAVVIVGYVVFALGRSDLALLLVAMSVLGFGVGSFSAAMPEMILAAIPASETSSAMSFNGVLRSVGFSFGSALGGLILAAATPAGRLFPRDGGFTVAAAIGGATMVLAASLTLLLAGSRPAQRPSRAAKVAPADPH